MTCENTIHGKSLSRLVAVQALYSFEVSGEEEIDTILDRVIDLPFEPEDDQITSKPNAKFLNKLVKGVNEEKAQLDELIKKYLKKGWELDRLDNLILSILRPAVYELKGCQDVPTAVILDEYINIAHAFYETQETGFINAILDSIAQDVRKK